MTHYYYCSRCGEPCNATESDPNAGYLRDHNIDFQRNKEILDYCIDCQQDRDYCCDCYEHNLYKSPDIEG